MKHNKWKFESQFLEVNKVLKCLYGEQRFFGFAISKVRRRVLWNKNFDSVTFLPQNRALKFSFGHAQGSWPRNKRLETSNVTSGNSFFWLGSIRTPRSTHLWGILIRENSLAITEETVKQTGGKSRRFLTWRHGLFWNLHSFFAATCDHLCWT